MCQVPTGGRAREHRKQCRIRWNSGADGIVRMREGKALSICCFLTTVWECALNEPKLGNILTSKAPKTSWFSGFVQVGISPAGCVRICPEVLCFWAFFTWI